MKKLLFLIEKRNALFLFLCCCAINLVFGQAEVLGETQQPVRQSESKAGEKTTSRTAGTPALAPAGFKEIVPAAPRQNCVSPELYDLFWQNVASRYDSVSQKTQSIPYPLLNWPFINANFDGLVLGNYVDDDPTAAVKDYEGGPYSYDGHDATDIGLYHFRSMDRGMPVVAAVEGVVMDVVYSKFDRNIGVSGEDPNDNHVAVRHSGGSYAWYQHLRKNSITKNVGETVYPGDILGLTGSSGSSSGPHLHFAIGEYISGAWTRRDPWHGSNQSLPTLWNNQEPYMGTVPFHVYDMNIFTQTAAGGDLNNIPGNLFKERITSTAVMGANEPYVAVWFLFHCLAGDAYRLEIRRPDNTLYSAVDYTLPNSGTGFGHYWYWNFSGNVPPSDYGIWKAQIRFGGNVVKEVSFEVGATTVYAPRFSPIAGRSFRLEGTEHRDTLCVSLLGGMVTYSLLNPPPNVSLLADSIVVIAASPILTNRSTYFQAVATDGAGRKDTMWYHLVNPTACAPDSVPPVVLCRADTVLRCGASVLNFTSSASDNCSLGASVVCTPPSGSTFPPGVTMVTCVATDQVGNQDTCGFNVTMELDTLPPVVQCAANISTNTLPGQCGRAVGFGGSASDNCSVKGVTRVCTPPSGIFFPVGVTLVTCVATDWVGLKDTCVFTVTVNDVQSPVVTCPADTALKLCAGQNDSAIAFATGVTDNCPGTQVVCTPPSGSGFPAGVTPVTCIATDRVGRQDTCFFTVTVTALDRGDMNRDGLLSSADVVLLLNCAFLGTGNCELCIADVNCSGELSAADLVLELNRIFLGIPLPC